MQYIPKKLNDQYKVHVTCTNQKVNDENNLTTEKQNDVYIYIYTDYVTCYNILNDQYLRNIKMQENAMICTKFMLSKTNNNFKEETHFSKTKYVW
jgi:hypothetical protein